MGSFGVFEILVLYACACELLPGVEVLEVVVDEEVEDDGGCLGSGDVFVGMGGRELPKDLSAFHYYNFKGWQVG